MPAARPNQALPPLFFLWNSDRRGNSFFPARGTACAPLPPPRCIGRRKQGIVQRRAALVRNIMAQMPADRTVKTEVAGVQLELHGAGHALRVLQAGTLALAGNLDGRGSDGLRHARRAGVRACAQAVAALGNDGRSVARQRQQRSQRIRSRIADLEGRLRAEPGRLLSQTGQTLRTKRKRSRWLPGALPSCHGPKIYLRPGMGFSASCSTEPGPESEAELPSS